jgi:ABC-2 type transport system ATP-binding protein
MIQIRDLTKSYGNLTAISNLNFSVAKGEVVGFLGPNGAGKSTTMKIITGYMAPTSGKVTVAGFDVFETPLEVKRRIGFLPETPPVYTDMFVKDFLEYVARLKGVPKNDVKKSVDYALDAANIGSVQGRLIQNLSKGYKQRVGIAQALVSRPEILILDEPTVGLDPKQVAEIRTLIKNLKGHHTIILSTHILPEVQAVCERIIIINKGKIVAEDSLSQLNQKMAESKRLFVRVKKLGDDLVTKVRGIPGVVEVKIGSDINSMEIRTDKDEAIQQQIATTVATSDAGLIEMRSIDHSLEDIFLKVTSEGELI